MALKYQCKKCKKIIPYRDPDGNKTCGPERICLTCQDKPKEPTD